MVTETVKINGGNGESMSTSERVKWIDYSKGIGILLVVIAHGLAKDNLINIYSYSFHLPLFFLISGITLKEDRMLKDSFINIIIRNAKSILLPYYFYAMFIVAIELLKNVLQHDMTIESTIDILTRWIFMRGLKADWFLPCLFFSKIIFVGIYRMIKNRIASIIIVLALAMLVICIPAHPMVLRPIICAGIGSFFVGVGHTLRDIHSKLNFKIYIPFFIIWCITTMVNGKVSLLIYEFGVNGCLYLINGILGSIVVIGFTKYIEKMSKEVHLLEWLGKNSMIIMVVHMEIMAFVNAIITKVPIISNNVFLLKIILIGITLIASVVITPIVDKIYKIIFIQKRYSGGN